MVQSLEGLTIVTDRETDRQTTLLRLQQWAVPTYVFCGA